MKKLLLIGLISVPALLFGQGVQVVKSSQSDVAVNAKNLKEVDVMNDLGGVGFKPFTPKLYKAQPYTYIQIGSTAYDLQTNHSVGTRIVLHSDGTISAVWTTSNDLNNNTFPNRGTGYNYYDGADWGSIVDVRIEGTIRTGWPSIGMLGNGSEYVLAHDATTGGFAFSTNGAKGSSLWSTVGPILDDSTVVGEDRAPIWNASASLGDNIYMVSCYTNSGSNVDVVRAGVTNPVTYSRSKDNGQTWTEKLVLLPGYDSTLYERGVADSYAITAKDSVVAIVVGAFGDPVTLWKSTDYGDNFTKIDVDNFPHPGVNKSAWFRDTVDGTDGSMDVILDQDNKAHVFYGGCRFVRDFQNGDTSVFFFPGTARLMHWKEGMTEPQVCGVAIDRDGSNTLDITSETITGLDANSQVPTNVLTSARYSSNCLVTFPSAGIAANGDIYLVYSAPSEMAISFLNANYRDVLITFSEDNGDNWAIPQNITQDDFVEHVFASQAEVVDGNVHIIWQADDTPGTYLQNNDASASNHLVTNNAIYYAAIPTSAIKNGDIGQHTIGTQELDKAAEIFIVSQSYPNPNNGNADVTIYLLNGADVNLEITDMYGKVVSAGSIGYLNAGNHIVNLDASELASGMYYYTISTADHRVTRKMQVN